MLEKIYSLMTVFQVVSYFAYIVVTYKEGVLAVKEPIWTERDLLITNLKKRIRLNKIEQAIGINVMILTSARFVIAKSGNNLVIVLIIIYTIICTADYYEQCKLEDRLDLIEGNKKES